MGKGSVGMRAGNVKGEYRHGGGRDRQGVYRDGGRGDG